MTSTKLPTDKLKFNSFHDSILTKVEGVLHNYPQQMQTHFRFLQMEIAEAKTKKEKTGKEIFITVADNSFLNKCCSLLGEARVRRITAANQQLDTGGGKRTFSRNTLNFDSHQKLEREDIFDVVNVEVDQVDTHHPLPVYDIPKNTRKSGKDIAANQGED